VRFTTTNQNQQQGGGQQQNEGLRFDWMPEEMTSESIYRYIKKHHATNPELIKQAIFDLNLGFGDLAEIWNYYN
jgi:hypothetical protein